MIYVNSFKPSQVLKLIGVTKTFRESRQRLLQGGFMFVCLLLVSVNIGWGQGAYTPIPYKFQDQPHQTSNLAYPALPSVPSMASNGYGLWAVDGRSNKWLLLGNGIAQPDTTANLAVPPGTVASGVLDVITNGEAKVAANLNGSVRYVWYDPVNQEFVVQGFNDQSFGNSDTNQRQIDISISTLPKPLQARSVIKRPIYEYPRVSAPGVIKTITDLDWRNEFDIAMDRKYLYLVYRLYNASADTVNGKPYSIVIKAIELTTSTVSTYARLNAFRPTIACDVRNNPEAPTFDVGHLEPIVASSTWVGWKIWHASWVNGALSFAKQLPKFVRRPNAATATFNPSNLITASYQDQVIYQVRIVVSSKDGGTVSPQAKSMYILKYSPGQEAVKSELFYQKYIPVTSVWDTAEYVDGPLNLANRGCPTCPVQDSLFYHVVTEPIVAFANPYDGKRDPQNFEEFHCVYRFWNNVPGAGTQTFPLTIVREGENGIIRASEPDTRRILNKTKNTSGNWVGLPTPYFGYDTYAATANQMGIHVIWENQNGSINKIYYNRDIRSFDENIEENTLVTHDTYIGDGTTHQGTFGTKLLPGKYLTLWTDPSFALSTNGTATNSGVYFAKASHGQSYYNGRIIFLKNSSGDLQDAKLEIGNSANHISSAAHLVLYPNYEFKLSDTAAKNQQIVIHPYSTLNSGSYPFLTFPQATSIKQQFYGKGTITMDSNSILTCHGGSTFLVPDYFSLNATDAMFMFKYEQSVVPPYQSTDGSIQDAVSGLNQSKLGALRIAGTGSFHDCTFYAEHSDLLSNGIEISSSVNASTSGEPSMQFEATSCNFEGDWPTTGTDYGVGKFQILAKNFSNNPYRNIRIFESMLIGANIRVENPDNDVEITTCEIYRTLAVPIEFKRTNSSTYGSLLVLNNEIYTDEEYGSFAQSGVIMDGFDSRRSDDVGGDRIVIQDNRLFFRGAISTLIDDNQAAIRLTRTSANVKANIISSYEFSGGYITKFWKGIVNTGDKNLVDPRSNSFICSNRVSGCDDAGLHTEGWDGYAKSNQISECAVGHISAASDAGNVMFSRYFDNSGAGLVVRSLIEDNKIILAGKHEGSDDFASFDTIDHNNTSGVSGQIEIIRTYSGALPDIDFGSSSTSSSVYATYGHNNVISNSVNNKLIHYTPAIGISGNIVIDNFNENFWGYGNWGSLTPVTLLGTSDTTYMQNITYGPSSPWCNSTVYNIGTGVECGVEFGALIRKGNHPPQVIDLPEDECSRLAEKAHGLLGNFKNRQAYDTARYLLENCYNSLKYTSSFMTATSGAQGISQEDTATEKQIFADYRQWLVEVIHLNKDSIWYCNDVAAIFSTFNFYPNGRGKDYNGAISLLKYLIDSSGCGGDSIYWVRWQSIREDQLAIWRDTVQDSINSPLDTSLVSLEELGLHGIRGQQNSVSPVSGIGVSRLASVTAERNPFTEDVVLKVELTNPTLLRLDVFDELGRSVYGEGLGYKPLGEYRFTVPANSWASGVYYARISSSNGEVQTVKLIKQ
jgi:hypothetical protein